MRRKICSILTVVLLIVGVVTSASAALQAVGPITAPNGFPLYYTDTNNLSLELCLDEGWCFFDPIDPTDPDQVALGIGGEVFWWMGEALAPVVVNEVATGGNALVVLAMEGTFGGAEAVTNGNQISFGRLRVRVDVPTPGNYLVRHPFGELAFDNVTVADGINYTADIGAANFLNPELGFLGALQSEIGPFLTWPDYLNDESLKVRGPNDPVTGEPGPVLAQYVGNLNIPHVAVGSPIADATHPSGFRNYLQVVQVLPDLSEVEIAYTDLFGIMGKIYGGQEAVAHTYPAPPTPNLALVGPLNRTALFNPLSAVTAEPLFVDPKFVTDANGTVEGFPVGYPVYYQDLNGLQLTICQGGNPMCISDPVDPNDPAQLALNTGGESFWWSADAAIEEAGVDALLVLGTEGTFGGAEALIDGQQISFGRVRIRVDTPVAGDYTVVYPYGVQTFTNVPAGLGTINFTGDIGINDPSDPDFAMVGALFSEIGPNFLTWDSFDPTLVANDPLLVKTEPAVDADGNPILDGLSQPTMNTVHYVGDPAIEHTVTGGNFIDEVGEVVNYFRVIGPNGIDVQTDLFVVTGRVYDPDTYRAFAISTMPVANADAATTIAPAAVTIDVLANDSLAGAPVDPAGVSVALAAGGSNGSAVLNGDQTFTYTPNAGFSGTDTFTYTVTNNAVVPATVSTPGTVTVTVLPTETVGVNRAQLDLRKLRWEIRGSGNVTAEGSTITVRLDSPTGTVIGTATVDAGSWRLRAATRTAPPTGAVQLYVGSSLTGTTYGPFNVQVR